MTTEHLDAVRYGTKAETAAHVGAHLGLPFTVVVRWTKHELAMAHDYIHQHAALELVNATAVEGYGAHPGRPEALAPGFYIDDDGALACNVPALLVSQGIEPTPEAVDQATEMLAASARKLLPDAEVEVEE